MYSDLAALPGKVYSDVNAPTMTCSSANLSNPPSYTSISSGYPMEYPSRHQSPQINSTCISPGPPPNYQSMSSCMGSSLAMSYWMRLMGNIEPFLGERPPGRESPSFIAIAYIDNIDVNSTI
ncbi:unnamed protein product [Cyprideis torosa]|uniref:Uncharacterized protein n=1 Tax=Cyprideis torosa TaxID=163714 RepID=A0A7R8ZK36_9CRUS|nr:unnamed protein product [Cyprideis torosa]CAG0879448.1 unnamed protein product [Cyprideis torosa]